MDAHFQSAELADNLPVLQGIVGLWHRNVCRYPARAILPYEHRLARLPAYLQQLDMESKRQIRDYGRGGGDTSHRASGLGGSWDKRAARVLSDVASGHGRYSLRVLGRTAGA